MQQTLFQMGFSMKDGIALIRTYAKANPFMFNLIVAFFVGLAIALWIAGYVFYVVGPNWS
ncbi:MAG: hypothetical protein AAFR57_05225 [Pseudomonadota bacterium]